MRNIQAMSQDIIDGGVLDHKDIDHHLAEAYAAAQRLVARTEAGIAAGLIKPLAGKKLLAQTRRLPGLIADAAECGADLHIQGTKIAKDANLDTGNLTSVGGVTVLSGGR